MERPRWCLGPLMAGPVSIMVWETSLHLEGWEGFDDPLERGVEQW